MIEQTIMFARIMFSLGILTGLAIALFVMASIVIAKKLL